MGQIELKHLFAGLQKQMMAQFETNREVIQHPGSKGDATENVWIDFLRRYLPNKYSVEKAFIIDSEGNMSEQIDIVIYDNLYLPCVFSQNGAHFIPAESVYAVFEVKQDLTKDHIIYSSKKIASARRLKRTTTNIINSGKKLPPRSLTEIIGGILCTTSEGDELNLKNLEYNLKDMKGLNSLDMGCVVDRCSFFVHYNALEEKKNASEEEFRNHIEQYYNNRKVEEVLFSKKENSLVTFLFELSKTLQQQIGTVAAINYQTYLSSIGLPLPLNQHP